MTSWKEKFNSQPRGYQLLLYSKTCHCVHEQWAESIISTGFYGHHKFGTLRPQPPPCVSPSPSVSSCNAPSRSQHYDSHFRGKSKQLRAAVRLHRFGFGVTRHVVSLTAGLTQLDAPWTNPLTLAWPLKAIFKSVLMSTPRQMLRDLLVQAAHFTPCQGTCQSMLIKK